jgi:hypothetical protein
MSDLTNLAKVDLFTYEVLWNSNKLGYVKDINPQSLAPLTKSKTVGQLGPIVLDRVHLGMENPTISMTLQQASVELIRDLMPWAGESGAFELSPKDAYFSEYAHAQNLTLHPYGVDPSTVTDDVVLLKAFPLIKLWNLNAEQQNWRELPATFNCYMDQSKLPDRVWGYYGGLPVEEG